MKVSIIIPVYNSGFKILKMLDSIKNQTYKNLEVIIINDGSTDNTKVIIEKFINDNNLLNFIVFNQKNTGPALARNTGLELATGDYILFFDADDTIELSGVEEMLKVAVKSDADIVQFGYTILNEKNEIIKEINHVSQPKTIIGFNNASFEFARHKFMDPYLWSKIFKKEILKKLKFDDLRYSEDQYFIVQALINTKNIVISQYKFYGYIQTKNSIVRSSFNETKLDSIKAMLNIIDVYNKYDLNLNMFYEKKICLYAIVFTKQIKTSGLPNSHKIELLNKMKLLYINYFNKIKTNTILLKNTKFKVIMYLYLHNFIFKVSRFGYSNEK